MKTTMSFVVCALAVTLAVPALAVAPPARQGHPMVPPYPGSTDEGQAVVADFDEVDIPAGPTKDGKFSRLLHLEGKLFTFTYGAPEKRSILEVFRNYEAALKKAGFTEIFSCKGQECGGQVGIKYLGSIPNGDSRYLAAKLARPQGDVYVALHVGPLDTAFVVLEVKPMEADLVKISAEALNQDLGSAGHVAVYALLFDSGKAELKPESADALKEIARVLEMNPSLALHVVGHTDNVGPVAKNLDLSKRRATAVVAALTKTYKVAPARLRPDGVGPLAPVAKNDTEAGRALNRRVELVQQ